MRKRWLVWLLLSTGVALGLELSVVSLGRAAAQERAAPSPTSQKSGRSLEGVWTNASLTRLTRPSDIETLVLSPRRAEELAAGHFHNVRAAKDELPLDPDRDAPEVVDRLPPVGNYNASWVDPGSTYGVVGGEIRSSWLVEPKDGQIPFRPEVRARQRERGKERQYPPGPEALSLGERCVLGFGGTGGPPLLNVLYNNFYRIVETPTHVVILVEMVHDARIVRLNSERTPGHDLRWMGDSVGHWDGDTLVIETTGFHPGRALNGPLPYSENARVSERLIRVSDSVIAYQFEIEDPVFYTQRMRGEMSLRRVDDRVYEYACHEGNYAMPAMLKGARLLETEARDDSSHKP